MKKSLYLMIVLFSCSLRSEAAQWIVQENGCNCQISTSPSIWQMSTINGATTNGSLAVGDSIYIRNREGNLPYTEAVTITKGVDIFPYSAWVSGADNVFYCQGTWTINGIAGQTINIVGMYNYTGSIVTGAAATGGSVSSRCTVRLLGGQLGTSTIGSTTSGWINFNPSTQANGNYYDLYVIGMKIFTPTTSGQWTSAAIGYEHGSIIGDSIVTSGADGIYVANDANANADTSFIIGNVIYDQSTANGAPIYWTNNQIVFDIRNNYLYSTDYYGIYASTTKGTVTPINKIYNNTLIYTTTNADYGFYLNANSTGPSTIEVVSNVIARNGSAGTYGIYGSTSGIVNCYYNYVDADFSSGPIYTNSIAANIGNNTSHAGMSADLGTGAISSTYPPTSGATQATTSLGYFISGFGAPSGIPGYSYYNLGGSYSANGTTNGYTQNTIGCYGGPYNIQNYFSPSSTYPYQTAKPNMTYLYPGWVPTILTNGASVTTGMFKSASFAR